MVCQRCGEPAQGSKCAVCRLMDEQEARYGTPAEIRERQEADDE